MGSLYLCSFIRFCGCLMMTLKGLNIITLIPVQLEKFKMEPIRTEKTIRCKNV